MAAYARLDEELQREELILKDKYHAKWSTCGDRNTIFFHHLLKSRRVNKPLEVLHVDGNYIKDPMIIDYFSTMFSDDQIVFVDPMMVRKFIPI